MAARRRCVRPEKRKSSQALLDGRRAAVRDVIQRIMISRLSVAVVLSGALLASTAYARDAEGLSDGLTASNTGSQDLDLAAKHFEDGVRLYREGRYDLARVEFEAAFELTA